MSEVVESYQQLLGVANDAIDGLRKRHEKLRDDIEALHLIEPNDPDHPAWYFDGWHAALDAVESLVSDARSAESTPSPSRVP